MPVTFTRRLIISCSERACVTVQSCVRRSSVVCPAQGWPHGWILNCVEKLHKKLGTVLRQERFQLRRIGTEVLVFLAVCNSPISQRSATLIEVLLSWKPCGNPTGFNAFALQRSSAPAAKGIAVEGLACVLPCLSLPCLTSTS